MKSRRRGSGTHSKRLLALAIVAGLLEMAALWRARMTSGLH